uniref:G protein-coupled receptor n=1 Tax=Haemonchus contortus TaxID=6289 RepID=A0A7I4YMB4_HAECO
MELHVMQTVLEAFILCYYAFILLTIATSREKVFRSAFYILFVSTGIADIISLLSSFVLRMNLEPASSNEPRYIIIYSITAGRTALTAHMIGNTFITFNRYSSICLMSKYDKIWTRRNVFIIVVVQYAVSIAAVFYTATSKMIYVQADDGTYVFKGLEPHVAAVTACISSTIVIICLLISFGLDVKLFVTWHNLLKEGDRSTVRHVEKGLLIYTITAFILMILINTEDALYAIASITEDRELYIWVNNS